MSEDSEAAMVTAANALMLAYRTGELDSVTGDEASEYANEFIQRVFPGRTIDSIDLYTWTLAYAMCSAALMVAIREHRESSGGD